MAQLVASVLQAYSWVNYCIAIIIITVHTTRELQRIVRIWHSIKDQGNMYGLSPFKRKGKACIY